MSNQVFEKRIRYRALAIVWCASLGIILLLAWRVGWLHRLTEPLAGSTEETFSGNSKNLHQTIILPTLDSPIPESKSAIWCSSFQLAWNRLKTDVAREPIRLEKAEELADQLNQAEASEADLAPETFYAAAGLVRDGVVQRIQRDMAQKFPEVPRPRFSVPQNGAVAYGYLRAGVKFSIPFFENDERFLFSSSAGGPSAVVAFGIRPKDADAYDGLRTQIAVLFVEHDYKSRKRDPGEFILDPYRSSLPHQLLLARVKRQPTLSAMLANVQRKMAAMPENSYTSSFHSNDTLLVPNMNWRIEHHFTELEGTDKRFLNSTLQGLYLDTAVQWIRFRMDRSGAELESEAKIEMKNGYPRAFHFDRPFLIIMKKRDAKQPFFVMWVDNAELLCPR